MKDLKRTSRYDPGEYISSVKWQFAKTMPEIPHEYTVADWEPSRRKQFDSFVKYISENGYTVEFYGKKYMYLEADGYKYWAMPNESGALSIINRSQL